MTNKIPKRYCERCGMEMKTTKITAGYNRYTGKPNDYVRYLCPTLDWEEMLNNSGFYWGSTTFKGHSWFEEEIKKIK